MDKKTNICSLCSHLIIDSCIPYCEKGNHKDYRLIVDCEDFYNSDYD